MGTGLGDRGRGRGLVQRRLKIWKADVYLFVDFIVNLVKYIGLLALGKILPTHPKLVAEHKDLILECIDDPDISIRIRALDLIVGMVCPSS